MKIRVLPVEEWDRLPEDVRAFCGTLREKDVAPIVAEVDGVIVGRVLMLRAPHMEAWDVAPEYHGNAGVTRGLLRTAFTMAQAWGSSWVMANAEPGPMSDTLERLSGKWLPVHTFMLPAELTFAEEACPATFQSDLTTLHCSASSSALTPLQEVVECPQP